MLQMNLFQDLDERGGGGWGVGGMLIFVTPYVISTIFGVRESWCTENCPVNRDWSDLRETPELPKSSFVYTYIEDQLKKLNR